MPYLRVRIATPHHAPTAQQVATTLTDLAVSKLGKNASAAAVDVRFGDPADWFIGGQPLTVTGESSFFLEIKVTAGTNSRDDYADFIQATFAAMQNLLGKLAATSYIVVQNVNADAWGYGGQTQEYRYIAGKQ